MSDIPVISIIDDDELVRDAVKGLVRSLGYAAAEHASAEDYLRSSERGASSCLITDIQMPGMSGADLQAQLIAEGNFTPTIFMTAFDNENIRARAGSRSIRVPEKALSRWRPCSMPGKGTEDTGTV